MISSNHRSATANPAPVAQELERELSPNKKAGPFFPPTFSNSVWSPMGTIPKKHLQPSKWRIINDLSWPAGQSVNDPFSKELYTCSYVSIDQPISYLKSFGPNALISKLDHAFPLILVDPRDWENLGSIWPLVMSDGSTRTGYFFDMLLPFALQSSPALFLKFVNGLRYTMALHGTSLELPPIFWACGPPALSAACSSSLNVMLRTCADLGFATNAL